MRKKGILVLVLGVICAFVLGACGVLGIDGLKKNALKVSDGESGSISVEEDSKAAYSTGGQLKYPLQALNNARTLYNRTSSSQTGNYNYAAGSTSGSSIGNTGYDTIVLRPGFVYLFEVWGAQGGKGWINGSLGSGTGGYGGYSKGYYEVSSATTIYAYTGGQGGSNAYSSAGGYNGGGTSTDGDSDRDDAGGGGGGASDIRVGGTGLGNRIIVAGGGGGGGCYSGPGGAGGGESGGAGTGNNTAAAGTQSSGYSLGTGQAGRMVSGGVTGAGGGGYYGGYTASSGTYQTGGGGGSGYVGGVKWQTGTANGSAVSFSSTSMMSNGAKSGAGQVKITEFTTINIKSPIPSLTNLTRGAQTSLLNTAVATEYGDNSYGLAFYGNGSTPEIYYLNGSTYTNANGRYVTGVTVSRSSTTAYSQTLYFTPRVYMNNQTLYVKMHSNKYNFEIFLPFTVSTSNANWAARTWNTTLNDIPVKVGTPTQTGPIADGGAPAEGAIYNPVQGTTRHTMFITLPVGINSAITINATDLYSDADNTDGIYIASANQNGNTADYDVTLNAKNDGLSFTTNGSVTIRPKTTDNTGYMRLTLTLRNYEKLANYTGVSLPSGATLESSGHVRWAQTEVDVVFRLDNTRPIPMSGVLAGSKADAALTIVSGTTETIYVNQFAYDPDRNVNRILDVIVPEYHFVPVKKDGETLVDLAATSAYYDYAKSENVVKVSGDFDKHSSGCKCTYHTAQASNVTGMDTRFSTSWISTNAADGIANVAWRIRTDASNGLDYIEFTGIRATNNHWDKDLGHFYVLVHLQDQGEEEDTGIWLPIAITVTDGTSTVNANKPAYELNRNDSVYLTPWGATIGSETYSMGRTSSDLETAQPDKWLYGKEGINYLATDRDNYVYEISGSKTFGTEIIREQNDPLFIAHRDPYNDFLLRTNSITGPDNKTHTTDGTYSDFEQFFTAELVKLYMPKSVYDKLPNYETLKTNGYIEENGATVAINGLKITAKKSTQNMYIEFGVKVTSSRIRRDFGDNGNDKSVVSYVRVKVNSSAPTLRIDDRNGKNELGQWLCENASLETDARDEGVKSGSIEVYVKKDQIIEITPYDIVKDSDLSDIIVARGNQDGSVLANTNPQNGGFAQLQDELNKAYKVKFSETANGALAESGTLHSEGMRMDRLRFGTLGYVQNDRYADIKCTPDTSVDPNLSRSIDRITIVGKEKPNSQSVVASAPITVYDSQGQEVSLTIRVHVINSEPRLSLAASNRDYFRLSATGSLNATNDEQLPDRGTLNGNSDTNQFYDNPTAASNQDHAIQSGRQEIYYNVREFTIRELVYDPDSTDRERSLISISENPKDFVNCTKINGEFVPLDKVYVEAKITNGTGNRSNERVLRVEGKSSTQGLTGGLFLMFKASDTQATVPLYLQFEVMDSTPEVNTDGLSQSTRQGTIENSDGTSSAVSEVTYTWGSSGNDKRTASRQRFITSDADLGDYLSTTGGKIVAGLYKVIANDADKNQKVVPVAVGSGSSLAQAPIVVPESQGTKGVLPFGQRPTGQAAVWLTYYNDSAKMNVTPSESYTRNAVHLRYFRKEGTEGAYTFTEVTPATWAETLDLEWVIEVDNTIITSTYHAQLHFTLASSNRNVYADKPTAWDSAGVVTSTEKVEAGTEGGYGATTEARYRQNGTDKVKDKSGNDVTNSVTGYLTVNLDIELTPAGLINNFEVNANIGNSGNGVTDPVYGTVPAYYAEYPSTDDAYVSEIDTGLTYKPLEVRYDTPISVPLSYFARLSTRVRVNPGEMISTVNYATEFAVENLEAFNAYAKYAIRIYDGNGNSWSGDTLNDNPYVTLSYADETAIKKGDITKYVKYGKKVFDDTISANSLMASNTSVTSLYNEDTRGITFTKKYQRSKNDVYIAIDLCEWQVPESARKEIKKGETLNNSERIIDFQIPDNADGYTLRPATAPVCTVTVKLNVGNSPMELVNNQTGGEVIKTSVGAANSAIFLSNYGAVKNADGTIRGYDYEELSRTVYNGSNVIYQVRDNDNVNKTREDVKAFNGSEAQRDYYRDKSLFLMHSLTGEFGDGDKARIDAAVGGSDSLKTYFEGYVNGSTINWDGFEPNPGYTDYFEFSSTASDTGLLVLRPVRKTALNTELLQNSDYWDDLQAIADEKNLGITINGNTTLDQFARLFNLRYDDDGFYYPLRLIAYDDFNNTGFGESSMDAVVIKVYIYNSAPSVNTMITDANTTDTISFSLRVNDEPTRSFDLATLMSDSDMSLNDTQGNHYYRSEYEIKKLYDDNKGLSDPKFTMLDLLTTDYIKVLTVRDNGNNIITSDASKSKPVSFAIGEHSLTDGQKVNTDITFRALQRVSTETIYKIYMEDNHGNIVGSTNKGPTVISFKITVANNRPRVPEDNIETITMTTGQEFTLLATGPDSFDTNKTPGAAGSNSLTAWNNNSVVSNGVTAAAEKPFDNGKTVYDGGKNLGTIICFTDDTPWALRFDRDGLYVPSDILEYGKNDENNYPLRYERDSHYDAPLAYTFKAKKPGTVTMRIRAFDESTLSYKDREITVVVNSTMPVAKTEKTGEHALPSDVTKITNETLPSTATYSISMQTGDRRTFKLTDFAYDIDAGDDALMRLTPILGSTYFYFGQGTTMWDPTDASNPKNLISVNSLSNSSFEIVAENFTTDGSADAKITTVDFRIADGSGATGVLRILLQVTVSPSPITANKVGEAFKVKSVLEYVNDENSAPSSLNLVLRPDATDAAKAVFTDKDLAAVATDYTVKLYSMATRSAKGEDGEYTYSSLSLDDIKKMKSAEDKTAYEQYLASHLAFDSSKAGNAKYETGDNVGYLWQYVDPAKIKFNPTAGTLDFVPKKTTVGVNFAPFGFYVEIVKKGSGEKNNISAESAFTFLVKNSAPTATPEVSDNMNTDRTRFLLFNAYREDSVEYTVFDNKAENRRTLFEDSDADDVLTVESVEVKRIDNVPQVYKLVRETDEGGNVVERKVTYSADLLNDSVRGSVVSIDTRNNKVRFTVNRRFFADKYNNLPTYIVYTVKVTDSAGNPASTDVTVAVNNSAPGLKLPADNDEYPLPENASMEFDGQNYKMTVRLERDKPETTINLKSFYTDRDFKPRSPSTDRALFIDQGNDNDMKYKYYNNVGAGAAISFGNDKYDNLFSVNATRDNEALVFRALSYQRGEKVQTRLVISDDTGAAPVMLDILLVIDNTAPDINPDVATELYIMGNNTPKSEYDDALDPVEYDLYDFIVDPNPGDLDRNKENRVQIGSEGGASSIILDQKFREVTHDGEVVSENLVYVLPSADKFTISPRAGYYGYQQVTINMRDGAIDGEDTRYSSITLMIHVTRNPSDVPVRNLELAYNKRIKITPDMLFKDENGVNQGNGFVIKTIERKDSSSTIVEITSESNLSEEVKNAGELVASKTWFIRALNENGTTPARVEIAILGREDGETVWQDFEIHNIQNEAPKLTDRYAINGNVVFQSADMVNNTATIEVSKFVTDKEEDVITLTGVKSKKSIVVDAAIDPINQSILLNFKGRGTSLITVTLKDESNREYTYTFVAENIDLPQLNFFMRIGANVQSNPLIYTIILCGILLLLIIIIIIIAAAKKKKRMREEIEALLVSEMELEEQMLKLASGPSPTFYQSYGYLPPTQNVQSNPQFMLGEGQNAPGANPNALGLNAGGGAAPNQNPNPTPPADDDEL